MNPRSKVVGSTVPVTSTWTETLNGNYNSGPHTWTKSYDYYRHDGEDIEDYFARKRNGELLPMTNWTQESISGSCTGYTNVTGPSGVYDCVTERDLSKDKWFLSSTERSDLLSDLELLERAEAYVSIAAGNIYSDGFDALTFLVELRKTIRMFKNFARSLERLAKEPGGAYNQWLEGRYGWRILVFEMFELMETLNEFSKVQRERYKNRAGAGDTTTSMWTSTWTGGYGDYSVGFIDKVEWSVRGNIIADVKPPKFTFNPIKTGWEVIPYSFVVDWFVNIGNFLDSLSFLALTSKYVASKGYSIRVTRTSSNVDLIAKSGWTTNAATHSSSYVWERTVRVPTTVPLSPSIAVRLNAYKVADLVALVLQLLRR